MFIVIFGLALTALLVTRASHWWLHPAADLGSMSSQWVTAHYASRHASSI